MLEAQALCAKDIKTLFVPDMPPNARSRTCLKERQVARPVGRLAFNGTMTTCGAHGRPKERLDSRIILNGMYPLSSYAHLSPLPFGTDAQKTSGCPSSLYQGVVLSRAEL